MIIVFVLRAVDDFEKSDEFHSALIDSVVKRYIIVDYAFVNFLSLVDTHIHMWCC